MHVGGPRNSGSGFTVDLWSALCYPLQAWKDSHPTLWKRYQRQPHYSKEHQEDKKHVAEQRLKENDGILQYLSMAVLRNLDPQMYREVH